MQRRRAFIIKCRWASIPPGWPEPDLIPDETLRAMFSNVPGKWSVGALWQEACLGHLELADPVIVDVGPLSGLMLTAQGNPDRTTTIAAAVAQAAAQESALQPGDVPVVMISPPPCDAGALGGYACLFDVHGDNSYMAHEFGHALGFDHSFGPAFGDPEAEYCDGYCVMSADIFGYRAPWADAYPNVVPEPPGLPEGWTIRMGPLPAAATVWKYSADFAASQSVVTVDLTDQRARATLSSYGAATTPSNVVLAIAHTASTTWLMEYRAAHGWDRGIGLGPKLNPPAGSNYDPTPPGVVIHRLNAAGRVVFVGVIDSRLGPGQTWRAEQDAFEVSLAALAPDSRWAEVHLGPPRLDAQRLAAETSPYGAALVSVNNVFVNEDHYVGWTGTANFRPNVAKSDDSAHQQAREDTANGNLALTANGPSMWVAWSGTNPAHSLNLRSGPPTNVFANSVFRPGDSSPTGPSLAMFQGRLFMAYMGENGGIYIVDRADDPASPAMRVGDERTMTGPALAAFKGVLYVVWPSPGAGTINLMSSRDGATWGSHWTFTGETTRFAAALMGAEPDRLYLAWTGTNGAQSLNLGMMDVARLTQSNANGAFEGKVTYPTSSSGAPALGATTSGYDLFLAWAGTDGPGNLYTAYVDYPFAPPPPPIT